MTNKEIIDVLALMSLQYSPRATEYKALNEAINKLWWNLPKKGEWIDVNGDGSLWKCSNCGETSCCRGKYCSDCGARMEN